MLIDLVRLSVPDKSSLELHTGREHIEWVGQFLVGDFCPASYTWIHDERLSGCLIDLLDKIPTIE